MLKKLRGSASNTAWFLSGSESKPTEPRCYRKSIKAYLKQATVRQVRPHALRHTFATTCLQAGCDVKTLSELLGHANANITLQRYVHSDLTRKRRVDEPDILPSGVYEGQEGAKSDRIALYFVHGPPFSLWRILFAKYILCRYAAMYSLQYKILS